MPLASAGVWFDSDTGDVRLAAAARRPAPSDTPYLAQSTQPPFVDVDRWAGTLRGRTQPRPWQPSTTYIDLPFPVLRLEWLDTSVAARRGQWRPAEPPAAQVLLPRGVTGDDVLSWYAAETYRPRARPFRVSDNDGFALPVAYSGGQIIAALGWNGDSGAGRIRVSALARIAASPDAPTVAVPFQEPALSLLGAFTGGERAPKRPSWTASLDTGIVPLAWSDAAHLGWAGDDRPSRRGAWRFSIETAPIVPLSWQGSIEIALVGWQTAQPELRRGRTARAVAAEGEAALAYFVTTASWMPLLSGPGERLLVTQPRRVDRASDDSPQNWAASQIAVGSRWQPGLDMQPALIRGRSSWRAETTAPLPDAGLTFDVPWLAVADGSRAQPQRPTWRAYPEWAAPAWIEAGVIIVAGPYYAVAGGVFQQGAVEGDAGTLS